MNKMVLKRIVDVALSIDMILLLSFTVTGMAVHEYLGIVMLVLVIVHQILNRHFYKSLKKRAKRPFLIYLRTIDLLLLLCFVVLMLSGLSMSSYVKTFLHGLIPMILARRLHLGLSYYMMILFGLHLGAHIDLKRFGDEKLLPLLKIMGLIPALIGLWIFIRFQGFAHLTFSLVFANGSGSPVFFLTVIEVILMAFPFVYLGMLIRNKILSKK